MPGNPYDDLFGNPPEEHKPEPGPVDPEPPADATPAPPPRFALDLPPPDEGPDDLDRLLTAVADFDRRAVDFSRLLTEMRVADHKVRSSVSRLFLDVADPHDRGSLAGERQYHLVQEKKFRLIIEAMRALAEDHLAIVERFDADIDEHYFNVEKTESQVASEKTVVMDGINFQRKLLAEAADGLQILRDGLADTERRMKRYVNVGGKNNISQSEYELIVRQRDELTSGRAHRFDFAFFDANLIDKAALSLGVFMKETSAQYLKRLSRALEKA